MQPPRFLKKWFGKKTELNDRRAFTCETPPLTDEPVYDAAILEQLTPLAMSPENRVAMATRCRDADPVPKVRDAGKIEVEGTRRIQTMHNGVRVVADGYYGSWMTDLIRVCQGHHEPQEERIFHEILSRLPPGGTMLELGGYWAFYTNWFLTAAPGRRAVVVEPDPRHLEVGRINLVLNGVDRAATLVAGYIGDAPGEVRVFDTEESGQIDARCFDVPTLMAMQGLDRLTILHCDIQGAEFSALSRAADLLHERRIDWVVVSTHHHTISGDPLTHQRCLHLLQRLGAAVVAEHDVQESYSGDGLIVARFCPEPAGWPALSLSYNRASNSLFRNPLYDLAVASSRTI